MSIKKFYTTINKSIQGANNNVSKAVTTMNDIRLVRFRTAILIWWEGIGDIIIGVGARPGATHGIRRTGSVTAPDHCEEIVIANIFVHRTDYINEQPKNRWSWLFYFKDTSYILSVYLLIVLQIRNMCFGQKCQNYWP